MLVPALAHLMEMFMSTKPNDALPTHIHRVTGDIVWPNDGNLGEIDLLPADYWQKEDARMKLSAETALIKQKAAEEIEAISPWWKQSNDIRNPTPEGAARFDAIDAIRDQSNNEESKLIAAKK